MPYPSPEELEAMNGGDVEQMHANLIKQEKTVTEDAKATEPSISNAVQASKEVQQKKKLTTRMCDYAESLQVKINEKIKNKEGEEVSKLGYIRKALLYALSLLTHTSAWILNRVEQLAGWLSKLLGTAALPVTNTYKGVRDWVKGDPETKAAMAA